MSGASLQSESARVVMKKQHRDIDWPPLGVRDLKPDIKLDKGPRLDKMADAMKKAGLGAKI